MINPSKVLIIVPAYNESLVIEQTLHNLQKSGFSLLVVDDGSSDVTASIVRNCGIELILHDRNIGQGAALKTGMAYGIANGFEYLVHFDADGQHDSKDILPMLEKLEADHLDIVLGSRFINKDLARDIPVARRFLLKLALVVDHWLSGLSLTDVHNGFRVLTVQAASRMKLISNGMSHASEIIWEIKRLNLKYAEFPVHIRYFKMRHKKSQSLYSGFVILLQLLKLKKKRKTENGDGKRRPENGKRKTENGDRRPETGDGEDL